MHTTSGHLHTPSQPTHPQASPPAGGEQEREQGRTCPNLIFPLQNVTNEGCRALIQTLRTNKKNARCQATLHCKECYASLHFTFSTSILSMLSMALTQGPWDISGATQRTASRCCSLILLYWSTCILSIHGCLNLQKLTNRDTSCN